MKKDELVVKVQELGGYETKAAAKSALEAVVNAIEASVADGERVELIGFGTFATKIVKGRKGEFRGKAYTTEDSVVPTFKAGKNFKDLVKGKQ